jgi:hypothetical protein
LRRGLAEWDDLVKSKTYTCQVLNTWGHDSAKCKALGKVPSWHSPSLNPRNITIFFSHFFTCLSMIYLFTARAFNCFRGMSRGLAGTINLNLKKTFIQIRFCKMSSKNR